MTVKIRQYCPEDLPLLEKMAVSLYREDGLGHMEPATVSKTADFLTRNTSFGMIFLAADESEVVGYSIAVTFWSNEYAGLAVILDELYVLPEFRNRGVGKSLIGRVEEWARSMEASAIFLETEKHNSGAQKLYESLSFRRSKRYHYIKKL